MALLEVADLIVGRVRADSSTVVGAFAVVDGRVAATGTLEALREQYPHAEVHDFSGATIVPGFHDAHIHLGMTADDALDLDASHATVGDKDTLLARIGLRAKERDSDSWVRGSRFDDAKTGAVTRWELDAVAGDVPTLVTHVAGHWAVANSAALQRFGYDDASVRPEGGDFGRDEDGRLDGRLFERAVFDSTLAVVPPHSVEERLRGLRLTQERWHAAGLTSICDALVTPADVELFAEARRRGLLTLRTGFMVEADYYEYARELAARDDFDDEWLHMVGIKAFVDGAVGGRTCLLSEPFEGSDYRGLQITPTETLREVITAAYRDGIATGVHANGDAAIRLLLDFHESLADAAPAGGVRHRIEHCSLVNDDILRRIKALDLVAVPFGGYAAYYGGSILEWYGDERAGRMFAHRSLLDAGITVAGSSDYPCGPYEPLFGMQSMVTRTGTDGVVVGESQRISAAEALDLFTVGAARATGEVDVKGRLEPGYLADFVVLAEDPLTCDPADIASIPVLATYVGGDCVWSAED